MTSFRVSAIHRNYDFKFLLLYLLLAYNYGDRKSPVGLSRPPPRYLPDEVSPSRDSRTARYGSTLDRTLQKVQIQKS